MAEAYGFNITDLSDLDQARYLQVAELAFTEACKWGLSISRRLRYKQMRSRSVTITTPAGIAAAITSAKNPGAAVAYTTPTESQVTITANQYPAAVQIDQMSEQASVIELVDSSLVQYAQAAALTFDYHAATAAITGTSVSYVGQSARASLTASDTMTLAYARRAHAALVKANAPQIVVPGYGPVYLAYVHPDVAYDLKSASSTPIFEGAANVNAENYRSNVLGYSAGFLWIESGASPLLIANGGDSNVDAYCTVFMGADAMGMLEVPVAPNKLADDIPLNVLMDGDGNAMGPSMVARVTYPGTNLGIIKEVGLICNFGFALAHDSSVYRVESASSIGANT